MVGMPPSKCPLSRPAGRSRSSIWLLKNVCWTREIESVVSSSPLFRKKPSIYSYVPGDSDHHPCMMQSTIRGELTRLLRTNYSVDSFEQEVKFFMLKWTRRGHDGKEFDRIAMCYLLLSKKTLVGGPKKIKSKPFVCRIQPSRSLRFSLFEGLSASM